MEPKNFIAARIAEDIESGRTPKVVLRFPPEPNGFLHLGHAKAIMLNDTLARHFDAELNLRFDDTNPKKESHEYVEAIRRDATWLSDRFTRVRWASEYFADIYRCAVHLITEGLAYVDETELEALRIARGGFGRAAAATPARFRSVADNLALFARMKAGEFADGAMVLRAKIDLEHGNVNMRDPVLYRIMHAEHHNTGNTWCIYPLYDFAHPISDALEGVTHSLCTLEFEDHRPLYDWVVDNCLAVLGAKPVQIEFARMDVAGVVLSKRKLSALVEAGSVPGWEAAGMPTLAGLRARGYSAEVLREFVARCGFSKANSTVELSVLEDTTVDVLGPDVERRIAVMEPVELVLEGLTAPLTVEIPLHPRDAARGTRAMTLSDRLWVDRADVRAEPEDGFWRLCPGNWVRLKHGLNVLVTRVEVDGAGRPVRVHAEVDMASVNMKAAKVKAKAVLHWLNKADAVPTTAVRYGALFDAEGEFDPDYRREASIMTEAGLAEDTRYEFERVGYFYSAGGRVHHLASLKGPGSKK